MIAVGTAWAAPALAQTGDDAAPVGDTAAPASGTDAARVEFARVQYREGVAAFRARRFGDAVVAFERSVRARPHPSTLYNLAEARLRAGDREGALESLRAVVGSETPAADAALVERSRVLAREAGENDLRPPPPHPANCPECPVCAPSVSCPEAPAPTVRVVSADRGPLPWILGGVGMFSMFIGTYGYAAAQTDAWVYNHLTDPMRPSTYMPNNGLVSETRGHGEAWRWVGFFGILAGVGLEVGAVYLLARPMSSPPPATPAPATTGRVRSAPAPVARVDFGPTGFGVTGAF